MYLLAFSEIVFERVESLRIGIKSCFIDCLQEIQQCINKLIFDSECERIDFYGEIIIERDVLRQQILLDDEIDKEILRIGLVVLCKLLRCENNRIS